MKTGNTFCSPWSTFHTAGNHTSHCAPKTPCRPRAPKSEFSREMALGTNESLYLLVLTAGNLKRDLEGNN